MYAKLAGIACSGFYCLFHQIVCVERFDMERYLAGFDLLQVEQVVDQVWRADARSWPRC